MKRAKMKSNAKIRRPISRARGEISVWSQSDCAIIPKTRKTKPFDSFQHFAFETVLRLIAPYLSGSRVKETIANGEFVSPTMESLCGPQCAPLSLCPLLYYGRHSSR